VGFFDRISASQPIAGAEPPSRAWYQWLTKLAILARQAYFLATSQIARIEQVNAKAQEVDLLANQALRLALSRREGELVTDVSLLQRAVVLLTQQNTALQQLAQMREVELQQQTQTGRSQAIQQQLRNANKIWQLETDADEMDQRLDTLTTSDVPEGSRLYLTNERVDDRVAALIFDGDGLDWTYDDVTGTLIGDVVLSAFTTDDLPQGANLYFTPAAARLALSATGIVSYNNTTGAFSSNTVSGWSPPTGTATRTAFDTASVTLPQLAERLKALIDDLTTRNVLGA
jgi:hypothetical protein